MDSVPDDNRQTANGGVFVSNDEIRVMQIALATEDGVFVNLKGAAVLPALADLNNRAER